MNGKQCTILWHIDGLKIAHTDDKEVTEIIDKLSKQLTRDKPLSITRGIIHEYLEITINFSNVDKVTFTMYDYIKSTLKELPEE